MKLVDPRRLPVPVVNAVKELAAENRVLSNWFVPTTHARRYAPPARVWPSLAAERRPNGTERNGTLRSSSSAPQSLRAGRPRLAVEIVGWEIVSPPRSRRAIRRVVVVQYHVEHGLYGCR